MKVLIVDENATNLKILSMLLAKDNYDVKTANSSDSALAKMSKSFDLVILDTQTEMALILAKKLKKTLNLEVSLSF